MLLKMENVYVELGERDVIKGVLADFHPGALTGVIGPNGAGKTTLLRALAGSATCKRREVSHWTANPSIRSTEKKTARRVGYLGQKQEPAFPFRVEETVMMGRYPHLGRLSPETETEPRGRWMRRFATWTPQTLQAARSTNSRAGSCSAS